MGFEKKLQLNVNLNCYSSNSSEIVKKNIKAFLTTQPDTKVKRGKVYELNKNGIDTINFVDHSLTLVDIPKKPNKKLKQFFSSEIGMPASDISKLYFIKTPRENTSEKNSAEFIKKTDKVLIITKKGDLKLISLKNPWLCKVLSGPEYLKEVIQNKKNKEFENLTNLIKSPCLETKTLRKSNSCYPGGKKVNRSSLKNLKGYNFFPWVPGINLLNTCDTIKSKITDTQSLKSYLLLLCHQVAVAVDKFHKKHQAVHLDIKRENIILKNLNQDSAKIEIPDVEIIDHSSAKKFATLKSYFLSFPRYSTKPLDDKTFMGMEFFPDNTGIDITTASDVYSLGATILEILSSAAKHPSSSFLDERHKALTELFDRSSSLSIEDKFNHVQKTYQKYKFEQGTTDYKQIKILYSKAIADFLSKLLSDDPANRPSLSEIIDFFRNQIDQQLKNAVNNSELKNITETLDLQKKELETLEKEALELKKNDLDTIEELEEKEESISINTNTETTSLNQNKEISNNYNSFFKGSAHIVEDASYDSCFTRFSKFLQGLF